MRLKEEYKGVLGWSERVKDGSVGWQDLEEGRKETNKIRII